jgi:hypothetical protein
MIFAGLQRSPLLGVTNTFGAYDFKNLDAEFSPEQILPPPSPPPPLNVGAIAGGIIVAIAVVALIIIVLFFFRRQRNAKLRKSTPLGVQAVNSSGSWSMTTPYAMRLDNSMPTNPYDKLKLEGQVIAPVFSEKSEKIGGGKFDIDFKDIKVEGEIGRGAFGTVYKGRWRQTEVAIKYLPVQDEKSEAFLDFKKEAEVMMSLRPHPNGTLFMYFLIIRSCSLTRNYCETTLYYN